MNISQIIVEYRHDKLDQKKQKELINLLKNLPDGEDKKIIKESLFPGAEIIDYILVKGAKNVTKEEIKTKFPIVKIIGKEKYVDVIVDNMKEQAKSSFGFSLDSDSDSDQSASSETETSSESDY